MELVPAQKRSAIEKKMDQRAEKQLKAISNRAIPSFMTVQKS